MPVEDLHGLHLLAAGPARAGPAASSSRQCSRAGGANAGMCLFVQRAGGNLAPPVPAASAGLDRAVRARARAGAREEHPARAAVPALIAAAARRRAPKTPRRWI